VQCSLSIDLFLSLSNQLEEEKELAMLQAGNIEQEIHDRSYRKVEY
jgi:hypothetical protein